MNIAGTVRPYFHCVFLLCRAGGGILYNKPGSKIRGGRGFFVPK